MSAAAIRTTEDYTRRTQNDAEPLDREWWTVDGDGVWKHVLDVVTRIDSAQTSRRDGYLRNARLYSNRELQGFGVGQYQRTVTSPQKDDRLRINVIRSCVDTGAAKIAKNKPRPLYLSEGGDDAIIRKAKARTKYVAGVFDETKNWHLMQRQFIDGCIYGTGAKKWFAENGRVKAERAFIHELLIDEDEGRYGDPRQLHHVRWMPRTKVAAKFPKHLAAIKAQSTPAVAANDGTVQFIRVVESWHLPTGKGAKDGRHLICIDGATLFDEKYDRDFFPFTFYRWSDALEGFYGESLVDELKGIQIEINRLLRTIQQAMHLACVPRVFMQAGSKLVGEITNALGAFYQYVGQKPVIETAGAMPPEVYQHLENLIRKAYEITGFTQLSASGKKPAGLDAAVALREYQDIETERFVLKGQRYEELALDDAKIVLALTSELAANGNAPKVKVAEGREMNAVDWDDADLDEDRYIVRPYPTAFLPSTPAGKRQAVAEMRADGLIETRDEMLELLDFPDIEEWSSLARAPREAIKLQLETILEKGKVIRPTEEDDPKIGLPLANLYLKRAETNGVSEHRLDLLRGWIAELRAMVPPPMPAAPPPPGADAPPPDAMGMPPPGGPPPMPMAA